MNGELKGRVRRILVSVLGASVALSAPMRAQLTRQRTVRPAPSSSAAGTADEIPLRSADGARIGTWRFHGGGVLLRPHSGAEVVAPGVQHWMASPDGRTLVGAGDPAAFEHPFELQIVVFRDGSRVAAPEERFAVESEATVGDDGRVALAGHVAGELGKPFALVLDTDGRLLYRHALPAGTLGRDPVLFGDRLLVRVHGIFEEGTGGSVVLVDASGARTLLDAPGALGLVGFPSSGNALVQARHELIWFDLGGRVSWRRAHEVRPAGPSAWVLWRTDARQALAVVTAGLRRRGESAVAPALLLLDSADGSPLGRFELDAAGPVCEVDVLARADELVVEWRGAQDVFRWGP